MTQKTNRLNLPYIQPAQAQKHVTHNEALEQLDIITQLSVKSISAQVPSTTPSEGESWIVAQAPQGLWASHTGRIASWSSSSWVFITPKAGWRAYDESTQKIYIYKDSSWHDTTPSLQNQPGLGIGTSYNNDNKLSVSSPATLFNHAGQGHQIKINKANTSQTGSLLYQSNWSGRAEIGLAGNDDLSIKTSDGNNWVTGMTVRSQNGTVQINSLLNLSPRATPSTAQTGDVYFDNTLKKLRCYDGGNWKNLW